jgi:hypothetical protein
MKDMVSGMGDVKTINDENVLLTVAFVAFCAALCSSLIQA